MSNKKKKLSRSARNIILVSVLAAVLIVLTLFIFPLNGQDSFQIGKSNFDGYWVSRSIKLGLDLEGGMYAVYSADLTEYAADARDTAMDNTVANLESLLFDKGYTEAKVTREGADKIRVEVPSVEDTASLISLIGKPADLEFRDSSGNVLIKGSKHLESAGVRLYEGSYAVTLKFNDEGTAKFAEATAANIGKTIAIYINGEEKLSPTVNSTITNGEAVITGGYTYAQAEETATQLNAGTFAVSLTLISSATIAATLGENALTYSIVAAVIGMLLVMVFMILIYKKMGIAACCALYVYIVLLIYLLALVPWVQLTLPSIAGVILSIGMAVDANVIIFERVRDEQRVGGKTFDTAIRKGFKASMSAIIDSNVTTILGAIVMLGFGASTVKSFAITLLIGIPLSMFTALIVTNWLLRIFMSFSGEDLPHLENIKTKSDSNAYKSLKGVSENEA